MKNAQPKVAIIGAGISGILVAITLLERGIADVTLYEKGDALGGTWRDNRYPGIACDVPAHLYVYSFAPNPGWTHRYAAGADIRRYYQRVADRYHVTPRVRLGCEIASADWQGDGWRLRTTMGETIDADIVISAVGRLHHPAMPDIAGLDSFAGPVFHSARWPEGLSIANKRIALIGTGSSATQITAAASREAQQLSLFQRTPQWVVPVANPPVKRWRRWLFRLFPPSLTRYYRKLEGELARLTSGFLTGDTSGAAALAEQGLATVADPALRARLTPDYKIGCKRLIVSPDFHAAIQRPNVALVDAPIDHVAPQGVVTRDGRLHPADIVVLATGFKVDAFMRPMTMTGAGGATLDRVWADGPMNYRSVMIPHMPNFFMVNGPYSPGGSASVVAIAETQTAYVMQCIDRIIERGVALTPSPARSAELLAQMRERAMTTIWATGGCQSWYLDKAGVPIYNPVSLAELKAQLAEPDFADFAEVPLRPAL